MRVKACENEVAHQREAHANARRRAIDSGDDRHAAIAKPPKEGVINGLERMTDANRLSAAALGEIGARAEAAAFAGDDDGAETAVGLLDEIERVGGAFHECQRGGVHHLGMVEREHCDIAVRRDVGALEIGSHGDCPFVS